MPKHFLNNFEKVQKMTFSTPKMTNNEPPKCQKWFKFLTEIFNFRVHLWTYHESHGLSTKRGFFFCRHERSCHETIFFQRHETIFFCCHETSFLPVTKWVAAKRVFQPATSGHETSFLKSPRNEFPRKEFKTCGRPTLIRDSPKIFICRRKNHMRVCVTSKDYSKDILKICK